MTGRPVPPLSWEAHPLKLDVMNIPIGRELDAFVAQHMFGWQWYRFPTKGNLIALYPPDAKRDCTWMNDRMVCVPVLSPAGLTLSQDWDCAGTNGERVPHFSSSWADAGRIIEEL